VLCIGFSVSPLQAQQIIIGSSEEDSLRAAQLAGQHDLNVSFAVRPLELKPAETSWKKVVVKALSLTLITQFNSQRPFGWNDGAMIQARGLQVMGRAGLYARYGIVELQAAPEWVYAANKSYDTSVNWGSNAGGVYKKFFPGQSSIGIRLGAVSMGVSTQNLWWGPGQRSSLLMSNNAPGFLHVYIRSNRPAKTPIGTFEWQLIGARLDSDSNRPYENFHLKTARESYPSTWRYQSAFVISYQPKWIPGLFVGMTRTLQRYQQDIGLAGGNWLKRYVPVLTKAFQKKNEPTDDAENTDQLASFFFRWVMPKSGWELYGEWGYNDYKQNIRDYSMDATHSAAYILGANKLFQTGKSQIVVGVETLKQSETPSSLLRGAGNWYVHGGDNGYTHLNQILGAGVGYGADLQSAWIKISNTASDFSFKIFTERIQRDPNNFQNMWIDMIWQVEPIWKSRHLSITSSINYIRSKNYLWKKNRDVSNWQARLSFYYSL
jgi:hypothetical protein